MLLPSVFGENLLDDAFPFDAFHTAHHDKLFGNRAGRLMKTDVRENEKTWELDIELPGFKKDQISATLKDGYLVVKAEKAVEESQNDEKKGTCIRRERWSGALSRAFYVGEGVREEDIKAKYEYGVLSLSIPKKEMQACAKKCIAIE